MLIGYIRVSTQDQQLNLQRDALEAAGAEKFFEEKISGATSKRPQLEAMLEQLRAGDVVLVYKLDRLSRSLVDLLHIIERIEAADARFRSLTEAIDTTTPAGRMMMQMVGAFAEFEREMIRERSRAGLEAAKARGVKVGRKPALSKEQIELAAELLDDGKTQVDVARLLRVSPRTLRRAMKKRTGQRICEEHRPRGQKGGET